MLAELMGQKGRKGWCKGERKSWGVPRIGYLACRLQATQEASRALSTRGRPAPDSDSLGQRERGWWVVCCGFPAALLGGRTARRG